MAFVPALNTLKVDLRGTNNSQLVSNTIYVRTPAAPSAADAEAIGDILLDAWVANMQSKLSNSFTLREFYFTDMSTSSSPTFSYTGGLPLVGTDLSGIEPGNVAYVIGFRTEGRGRSARGRNYISGLPRNAVSANSTTVAFQGAVLAFYSDVAADLITAGYQHVVVSKVSEGEDRPTALVQPVTSYNFTDLNLDSQRRRLNGRGV